MVRTWSTVIRAVTFSLMLSRVSCADQGRGALAPGIGDWYFDVDVRAEGGQFACLAGHFFKIVREDLQGKWAVGYLGQDFPGERFVVGNTHLAHQGGIGGEALDQGVLIQIEDAAFIGAVGEDLGSQSRGAHAGFPGFTDSMIACRRLRMRHPGGIRRLGMSYTGLPAKLCLNAHFDRYGVFVSSGISICRVTVSTIFGIHFPLFALARDAPMHAG